MLDYLTKKFCCGTVDDPLITGITASYRSVGGIAALSIEQDQKTPALVNKKKMLVVSHAIQLNNFLTASSHRRQFSLSAFIVV